MAVFWCRRNQGVPFCWSCFYFSPILYRDHTLRLNKCFWFELRLRKHWWCHILLWIFTHSPSLGMDTTMFIQWTNVVVLEMSFSLCAAFWVLTGLCTIYIYTPTTKRESSIHIHTHTHTPAHNARIIYVRKTLDAGNAYTRTNSKPNDNGKIYASPCIRSDSICYSETLVTLCSIVLVFIPQR